MVVFCRRRAPWRAAVLLLVLGSVARAEITTMNSTVRALGMGDAFTAVSRDGSALFYNPAGLSFVKSVHLNAAAARVGASGKDAYDSVKDIGGDSSSGELAGAIQKLYGKSAWAGVGADASVTLPHLAFGAYDHFDARVAVDNPVNPSLYAGIVNDYGFAAGVGLPVGDQLHLGAALRYVKRSGTRRTLGSSVLADLNPDTLEGYVTGWGRGYGVDLGASYLIPFDDFELTAAVAWRNVGQLRFHSANGTELPFEENDVTAGLATRLELPGLTITPAVDARFLSVSGYQLGRRLGFGVELSFPALDIRGGYREGYYTLGAGVNLGFMRVDAATYGVELGTYPGQTEDRRYVAEFSMSWDIGDLFQARRGRLKQRR